MTFLVGELAAEIRLEGQAQYERDLASAGSATSKVAGGITSTLSVAAGALTAASAGAVALGVSLFKTGAGYNTLQQTSRAALRTLVGGAEAANVQMDKLDAFARTSPFSKSVFLSAQQQLIGFGVEANKVIPILDAVQNATAAVGGSNQQISEIVAIIAKIQSSAKITAVDLMQMGNHGVDAAGLMGLALGKTGQEIREQITDGALDAGTAIDALTRGMDMKFGGAAANVKATWVGAVDRIKAGTREIGAALAEPFIAQQGGGMAVTWGNQVADVLQGVRGHAAPVVSILTGELAPAFADITRSLDRANVAVKAWDSNRLQAFLDRAPQYAPALAGIAGGLIGFNSSLLRGIPVLGQFVPAVNPVIGALLGIAAASPEVRSAGGEILHALSPLAPAAADLAQALASGLNVALPIVADLLSATATVARPVADIVASIPSPVLAAGLAFLAMRSALGPLAPALQRVGEGIAVIMQQIAVQSALAGMAGNTSRLAGAAGVASIKVQALGGAIRTAFLTNPVGLILVGIAGAAALLTAAFTAQAQEAAAVNERVQTYRGTLNSTTGALTDATRAQVEANLAEGDTLSNLDKLGFSRERYIDAILGTKTAQDELNAAMSEYARVEAMASNEASWHEAFNDTYKAQKQLIEGYEEQSGAITAAAEATRQDTQAKREAAAAMSEAERSNQRFNDALAIARDVANDATSRLNALKQALDELNGGTRTQAELTRDLNEQALNLADAFAATDENGNALASTLVSQAGAIDQTTRAGLNLHDQVTRLNDDMLTAIQLAVDEAKARGDVAGAMDAGVAAAQPYIDKLRAIADEAGLSEEQIDGMIATMFDTPEVVAFAVTDEGTMTVKQKEALALAQQILNTPDGTFTVSSSSFPGLMSQLQQLGIKTTTLPDGTVTVIRDDGSFVTVERSLNNLARSRTVRFYADGSGMSIGGRDVTPYATGGAVSGPGTGTSDSIPALLSNGEHVLTAAEVAAAGGHGAVMQIRAALRSGVARLATGGAVGLAAPMQAPIYAATAAPTASLSSPGVERLIQEVRAQGDELRALRGALGRPNVAFHNPVSKDVTADAWEAAQLLGVG